MNGFKEAFTAWHDRVPWVSVVYSEQEAIIGICNKRTNKEWSHLQFNVRNLPVSSGVSTSVGAGVGSGASTGEAVGAGVNSGVGAGIGSGSSTGSGVGPGVGSEPSSGPGVGAGVGSGAGPSRTQLRWSLRTRDSATVTKRCLTATVEAWVLDRGLSGHSVYI